MRPRSLFHLVVAVALGLGSFLPAGATAAAAPAGVSLVRPVPNPGPVDAQMAPASLGQNTVQVLLKLRQAPVARVYAQALNQGYTLSATEQQSHRELLTTVQNQVLDRVATRGGQLVYRFQNALNGVLVKVPASALPELAELPEVEAIYPARPVELHTDSSVPYIGADQVWELLDAKELNVTGRGIRVAVIDTGIDYYHAAFGGPGDPAVNAADNPTVIEPGTFPTAKVVGGYDLAGEDYDADDPNFDVPQPDPDPLDLSGHGTHVASTIGGVAVEGKLAPGVAPDVLLYAYKVFGTDGSTNLTDAAIEMAMDPNGDGNLNDHVDVINMSLGSPFGEEIEGEIAQNAVDLGIIVVASAGNSGDVPYITGSPAVAPGVISVAASVDDGVVRGGIQVNSPASIAGTYAAAEAAITPTLATVGDVTGDLLDFGNTGCDADTLPDAAAVTGRIALISRGSCTFAEKILNAQDLGATAVVVVNNVAGDPITMGGDSTGIEIPAVMITLADGETIRDALSAGDTVNVTLSASIAIPRPDLADSLASFTSRGPGGAKSAFKPDLAAPGYDILAAATGTGTEGVLMSGTSMAAPHVAGAVALLRQLHPDWTVEEIKAVLQNTSTPAADLDKQIYPLTLQGTGRIQLHEAAQATVVALPGGISFGYVPVSGTTSVTRTVTIRNKSNSSRTFDLSLDLMGTETGWSAELSADQVTVPARGQTTVDLTLTFDPAGLPDQWTEPFVEQGGWIRLQEQGGESEELVVGFTAFPEVTATVEGIVTPEVDGTAQVNLSNSSAAEGLASPFYLVAIDGPDAALEGYASSDVRYIGVRANVDPGDPTNPADDSDVLEFAVVNAAPWAAEETAFKDIYLDVDQNGQDDYVVFTYNNRELGGGNENATFIYDLITNEVSAYYYTPLSSWYNANQTIMTVPMWAVGLTPGDPFTFTAQTYPASGAGIDFAPTTRVDGALTLSPLSNRVLAPSTAQTLSWSDMSRSLLLVYPDNPPGAQSQAITFPSAVPAAPENLVAINHDGAVELVWDRNTDDGVSDYLVYRYDSTEELEQTYRVAQSATGEEVRFTDTSVTNETDYTYQVYALTSTGVLGNAPAEVTAHPSAAPAMPAGFTGTTSRGDVELSWQANTEADLGGYSVYKMDLKAGTWSKVASLAAGDTSWTDENPTTGEENTYGLAAVDQWGVESPLATVTVRVRRSSGGGGGGGGGGGAPAPAPAPKEPPAGPPAGVKARAEDGKVTLSWSPVEGATQYKILWGAGPVQPTLWQELATVTGTEYTWPNLTNGVTYWFKIVAVNDLGTSAESEPMWAMPLKAGVQPGYHPHNTESLGYSGTWVSLPAGEERTQAVSNTAMGSATITFNGAGIAWLAQAGPDRGFAMVYLDGVPVAVVDLYQPEATGPYVAYEVKGLTPGNHSLSIVVTGLKRAEAAATYVSIEGFVVHPEQAEAPEAGTEGSGATDQPAPAPTTGN